MEFFSARFERNINEILRSEKPLIAVVHRSYVKTVDEKMEALINVTSENREEIVTSIVSKILRK